MHLSYHFQLIGLCLFQLLLNSVFQLCFNQRSHCLLGPQMHSVPIVGEGCLKSDMFSTSSACIPYTSIAPCPLAATTHLPKENDRKEARLTEQPYEFDLLMDALYRSYLMGNADLGDLWSLCEFAKDQPIKQIDRIKQVADLSTIQEALDKDQCLLSFYHQERNAQSPGRLFTFIITRERASLDVQPDTELNTTIKVYINQLSMEPIGYMHKEEVLYNLISIDSLGQRLSGTLLDESIIGNFRDLIIIPHKEIVNMPFSSLPTSSVDVRSLKSWEGYPFLIQKISLQYAFSATWWQAAQLPSTKRQGCILTSEEQGVFMERMLNNPHQNFIKLADNRQLIKLLSRDQIDLIYLSMHGDELQCSVEELLDSLEKDPNNTNPLSRMSMVLAGCETAVAKFVNNPYSISISRKIANKGAEHIIASLWNVPDLYTGNLFKPLLTRPIEKSTDLNKMFRMYFSNANGLEYHPYYWAAWINYSKRESM